MSEPGTPDEGGTPVDDDSLLGELGDALRDTGPDDAPPAPDLPGYEIDREISRGGQGVVYLAYHPQTKRRVAIKTLLKRSLATPKQAARFEREVELVAALRHPGIVTLYDSGVTEDGTPFLVMEFVEGERVDRALRSARDSGNREKIVRTLIEVCEAVGAAHLRGIIHRDLKPSNVLLDKEGRPRVVDFGLAREAEAAPQGEGVTIEGEFVGTLYYSTPEQVSSGERAVDVRTDVYALGLMLYELLLGRLPYSAGDSLSELIKAIAEEEPQRPRRIEPDFPMDLEAVLLKCLEKEQAKRYATALDFADDLRATLEGLPVTARQHDRWYLFRKSMWRYRYAVGAAAVFVMMVTVFGVAMAVLYVQAETARKNELAARENEERINGAIVESVSAVNQKTSDLRIGAISDFLDEMSLIMDDRLTGQPDRLIDVRGALGEAYLGRGDATKARDRFRASLDLLIESGDSDEERIALAERGLGRAEYALADYQEAERLYRSSIERLEKVMEPQDPRIADGRLLLGITLLEFSRYDESEEEIRAALIAREAAFGRDSEPVAEALHSLARCVGLQGDSVAAAEISAEAVERLTNAIESENDWRVARALTTAARYLMAQEQTEETPPEELFAGMNAEEREAERRRIIDQRWANASRDFDRAETMLLRALQITRLWEGADGRDVAGTLRWLVRLNLSRANLARRYGEDTGPALASAAEYADRVIETMQAYHSVPHPDVAEAYSERAGVAMSAARYDQAVEAFSSCLELYNRLYPADHYIVGLAESNLGAAVYRQRRYEEGEALMHSGRAKVVAQFGESHPNATRTQLRIDRAEAWRAAVDPRPVSDDDAEQPPRGPEGPAQQEAPG